MSSSSLFLSLSSVMTKHFRELQEKQEKFLSLSGYFNRLEAGECECGECMRVGQ